MIYFKSIGFLIDCRKLGLTDEQAHQLSKLVSQKVEEALEEAIELMEGYVDVKDSPSGPVANDAMKAIQILQEAR